MLNSWTSYTYLGGNDPVSREEYDRLRVVPAAEYQQLRQAERRSRWRGFLAEQEVLSWRLALVPVAGLALVGLSFLPRNALPADWDVWPVLVFFIPLLLGLRYLASWCASALSFSGMLEARDCHYRVAREVASESAGYEDYCRKHRARLGKPVLFSGDARLALLLALAGLLVVPIPATAPAALILGVVGIAKNRRYAKLAVVLAAIELTVVPWLVFGDH